MKQFFKMLLASVLGTFIGILCLSMFYIFMLIALVGSMSKSVYIPNKGGNVLKISMNGSIEDYSDNNPFSFLMTGEETLSLKDILDAIDRAKTNDAIKGIYLETGIFSSGTANVDAIRRALEDFRESGKFIVAYADDYTQGGYYLASVADHICLNPKGLIGLQGFASETMFYKGLLQKIGIEIQVFKVGTYKGAVEPYIADHLSDANREQITSYMGGIWDNVVEEIARSRKLTVDDINRFADEGLFFADASVAVEWGLIDSLQYRPDVEDMVKELAGQTSTELKTVSISQMLHTKVPKQREYHNKIAVIYAEGEIVESDASSYMIAQKNITERLADKLRKLGHDENVKAVVFRVNSPGGSAYVSEQIWRQVAELDKKKPVIVSMGSVAASGGYYISCAARKIVAEANTLTGSIGIFGMFPNAEGLFNKLDLTTDIVKTNKYADMGNMNRPMTEEEKMLLQSYIERGYDLFITRCADGRNMSKADIDSIGQGRVWTGEQALANGLVDELGGIERAIELAVEQANIYNYTLMYVPTSDNPFLELFQKQLEDAKTAIVKDMIGSEEYEYLRNLQNVKILYGVKARIPYDMKPL